MRPAGGAAKGAPAGALVVVVVVYGDVRETGERELVKVPPGLLFREWGGELTWRARGRHRARAGAGVSFRTSVYRLTFRALPLKLVRGGGRDGRLGGLPEQKLFVLMVHAPASLSLTWLVQSVAMPTRTHAHSGGLKHGGGNTVVLEASRSGPDRAPIPPQPTLRAANSG
jgi:hypothetical protein